MAISNYELMRNQMRGEFTKYDQQKMIDKFRLRHDTDYLYLDFVGHAHRINRHSGIVEWSEDGFATAHEADYNASMTIYDVLCWSKDGCKLSGSFCPTSMLKGTVQSGSVGQGFGDKDAEWLDGKLEALKKACSCLGEPAKMNGDAAYILYPFDFLPVTLQYWEADEEFSANLKFMFDENIMEFMHFETTFFMVGHILHRIRELMCTECMP